MADNEYDAIRALVQASARMREEMGAMRASFDKTANELLKVIDRVTLERDEARREVCALDADTVEDQREYAAQRGWDCFGGQS